MSFILDALKKSENERQKQTGPALFEVKVAAPKPGLPLWAVALAVLLVVNIGVVIWLVLRKPPEAPAQAPVASTMQPAGALPVTPAPLPPPAVAPQQAAPAQSETPETQPQHSAEDEAEPMNPEDYEPAAVPPSANSASVPEQSAGNAPTTGGRVTRGTMEGFPTYEELAARTSLPELRLDMHVFSAKPQDRFVFINMQRVREGDSLPSGVHVEQITPDGVVLSHQGRKFVLERE